MVAPGFANTYMVAFERLFVYLYNKQPELWLRFIDDVFMIWLHGKQALNQFLDYLNSCVET